MPYATLVELKCSLPILSGNPTESPDTYLLALLSQADALIDSILGRPVWKQIAVTERLYVESDRRTLNMMYGPIAVLNSISEVENVSGGGFQTTALDRGDFDIVGDTTYQPQWKLPAFAVCRYDLRTDIPYEISVTTEWDFNATGESVILRASIFAATWFLNKRKDAATLSREPVSFRSDHDMMLELRSMLAAYIPVIV